MMKFKIISIIATLAILVTPVVNGATKENEIPSPSEWTPNVCMFSLSSYSGTINVYGDTESFTVSLSCQYEEDQNCTVTVMIDGYREASKVVTIPAGKITSIGTVIKVDKRFSGKTYRLSVI